MSLFDAIFSRRVTPDVSINDRRVSAEVDAIDGKPVIMADSNRSVPSSSGRPPVIFENGIR
jgi:hypothetical protein